MSILDELERLHKAATPGPWKVARWGYRCVIEPVKARYPHTQYVVEAGGVIDKVGGDQDANIALIAASRNALPALLRLACEADLLFNQPYEAWVADGRRSHAANIRAALADLKERQ